MDGRWGFIVKLTSKYLFLKLEGELVYRAIILPHDYHSSHIFRINFFGNWIDQIYWPFNENFGFALWKLPILLPNETEKRSVNKTYTGGGQSNASPPD